MLVCPQCGASSPDYAVFCQRCGTPVTKARADEAGATSSHATSEVARERDMPRGESHAESSDDGLPIPENVAGVMAYITITPAIVFLFVEPFKRNFFVRFHAFQHLFLWIAGFALSIVAGILSMLMQLIPFMRVLVFPLGGLIGLAWFFLWVLLIVKAYQHELFKLPFIGDLAEQRAGA
jgi:uncharacterized membrane protein